MDRRTLNLVITPEAPWPMKGGPNWEASSIVVFAEHSCRATMSGLIARIADVCCEHVVL